MTDKLKPVQFPFNCRCGVRHAKLATARWDKVDRLHYDCTRCRPRPQTKPPAFDPNNFCPTGGRFGCRCKLCQPMRKASPYCRSGSRDGCTCSMCF